MVASDTEIARIAATYPPEAAGTPRSARERLFSDAQRLAWEIRFGTPDSVEAELQRIEDMRL